MEELSRHGSDPGPPLGHLHSSLVCMERVGTLVPKAASRSNRSMGLCPSISGPVKGREPGRQQSWVETIALSGGGHMVVLPEPKQVPILHTRSSLDGSHVASLVTGHPSPREPRLGLA